MIVGFFLGVLMNKSRTRFSSKYVIQLSIVSMAFFTGISASASPLGKTGKDRSWKTEWTGFFKECFEKYGQDLKKKTSEVEDKRDFCGVNEPTIQPVDFWLSIYIPLAKAESHFNPDAHGKNGKRVPLGLYQMDATDMKSNGCGTEGGSGNVNPTSPKQSICCAIKIGNKWAQKRNKISEGKHGILAEFFQPIRSGMGGDGRGGKKNDTATKETIMKSAKRLCQLGPATSNPNDLEGTVGCLEDFLLPAPQRFSSENKI